MIKVEWFKIIGNLLVFQDRARYWIISYQFLMVTYVFLQSDFRNTVFLLPFNVSVSGDFLIMLGVVSLLVLTVLDFGKLFASQQKAASEKNPVMMEILERVKRLEEMKDV